MNNEQASQDLVRIASESTVNCSGVSRCDTLHILDVGCMAIAGNTKGINFNTPPGSNIFVPENEWLEEDRFLLGWCIFRGMLVSGRVILLKTTVCQSTMGTLQFKNYMDLDGQGVLIGNCHIEIQNESSTKSVMSSVIPMAHPEKKQQLPWPIAILKIHENTIWNAKIWNNLYIAQQLNTWKDSRFLISISDLSKGQEKSTNNLELLSLITVYFEFILLQKTIVMSKVVWSV